VKTSFLFQSIIKILSCIFIPLIIVSYFFYKESTGYINRDILLHQKLSVETISLEISKNIEKTFYLVNNFKKFISINFNMRDQALKILFYNNKEISEINITDADYNVLSSLSRYNFIKSGTILTNYNYSEGISIIDEDNEKKLLINDSGKTSQGELFRIIYKISLKNIFKDLKLLKEN